MTLDPTDGAWWWTVSLSGVIPGLLGFTVAWIILRRTVEEGRRQARHSGAMGTAARIATMTSMLSQDLSAATQRIQQAVIDGKADEWWAQVREIQALNLELWARTLHDWPGFAESLEKHRKELLGVMAPPHEHLAKTAAAIITKLAVLSVVTTSWLADPTVLDKKPPNAWTRARARRKTAVTTAPN